MVIMNKKDYTRDSVQSYYTEKEVEVMDMKRNFTGESRGAFVKRITRLYLLKRFKDKPNHNLQNISSGYKRNIKASSSYSPYELKLIDALRMRTGEDRGTFVRRIVCLYLQDLLTIIE